MVWTSNSSVLALAVAPAARARRRWCAAGFAAGAAAGLPEPRSGAAPWRRLHAAVAAAAPCPWRWSRSIAARGRRGIGMRQCHRKHHHRRARTPIASLLHETFPCLIVRCNPRSIVADLKAFHARLLRALPWGSNVVTLIRKRVYSCADVDSKMVPVTLTGELSMTFRETRTRPPAASRWPTCRKSYAPARTHRRCGREPGWHVVDAVRGRELAKMHPARQCVLDGCSNRQP